jgi:hypothetical protein
VGREFARARQNRGGGLDEGQAQVLGHGRRQRLAGILLQRGLGIEKIHLAGSALHEQADNVLGVRREMRCFGRERIGDIACQAFTFEEARERERLDSTGTASEERPARLDF